MYIKSLKISNLRCFAYTEIQFKYPGNKDGVSRLHNINLLLGNNGFGKTTVLEAISLAVLSPVIHDSGFVPYKLVRQGSDFSYIEAEIILHEQDFESNKNIAKEKNIHQSIKIVRKKDFEKLETGKLTTDIEDAIYTDDSPAIMIIGYGATRRVEQMEHFTLESARKRRQLRYQRVAGLFEDYIGLTPLSAWLPNLEKKNSARYKEIKKLFQKFLPENIIFNSQHENGEIQFIHGGIEVPFGALSDGYRAYIGWVGDLLYHLHNSCPVGMKLAELRGVILVDEVDLHLHPEWQRDVLSTLSMALPKMQFIVTSHSPIVAGSLSERNIFVMESEGTETVSSTVKQYKEKVYGLDADQILLSSYFNLKMSRAKDFENELHKISQRAWKGDTEAAVEFLKKLADPAML